MVREITGLLDAVVRSEYPPLIDRVIALRVLRPHFYSIEEINHYGAARAVISTRLELPE